MRRESRKWISGILCLVMICTGAVPAYAQGTAPAASSADAAGNTVSAGAEDPAKAGVSPAGKAGELAVQSGGTVTEEAAPGEAADGEVPAGTTDGEASGDGALQESADPEDLQSDAQDLTFSTKAKAKTSWTPGQPLPAPAGLTVAVAGTQLVVSWKASDLYSSYEIQYAKNVLFLFAQSPPAVAGTSSNLTLNGLDTNVKYYVRVRGVKKYSGKTYTSEWVRVATPKKSAEAPIQFVTKNGKKVDVCKQAGKKLKGYTISQGSCSDGTYLYMAFEKRNGDDNGKKRARIKIVKVRIADWKVVKVSSSGQKLGHANDLTYNPYRKYLVVTGAKTKDPYVRIVSPETLLKTSAVKIALGKPYTGVKAYNAIDYDPATHTYCLRSRNYGGLTFTLNDDFKLVNATRMYTTWPSRHVQSCAYTDGNFIITQSMNQSSKYNTITVFDKKGSKLQDIKIKMKGELESVFMIGGKLFATMHKKTKKYKKGFIFQILL